VLAGGRGRGQPAPGRQARVVRQRLLALDGAAGGADVAAAEHQESVAGQLAQPQAERQVRVAQVFREAAERLHLGLLDHVGRIDPGAQPGVEAAGDELEQVGAVPGQQLLQGGAVAALEPAQQGADVGPFGHGFGHGALLPPCLQKRPRM
jgi:hypothetical protein